MGEANLNELFMAVGTLNGKMDTVIAHLTSINQRIDSIETRVGKLENHKSYLAGGLAVLALCADKIWTFVSKIFGS